MIRVANIGDSHFDRGSRFDECLRVHRWIAQDLAKREPNVIVHTGDVFEGPRSTPEERAAVAEWITELAETAPVLLVRGNHDPIGDLPLFARLRTRNPVDVCETVGVYRYGAGDRRREIAIAAMAWPRKAHLHAGMQADAGQEETQAIGQELLRNVLRSLAVQLSEHRSPHIFAGHVMVRGSRTSVGQPLVGCDHELGLEDLALARCAAYLLGHIHMPQGWTVEGAPVIYPGSPRRTTFGEVEEKGYVLLEVDPETDAVRWERVQTPCAPMLLVEGEYVGTVVTADDLLTDVLGLHSPPTPSAVRGAEIRLRYLVAADEREVAARAAERQRAEWLAAGAANVKVEEQVVQTVRARAPEVASAITLADKLRAVWRARDDEPAPERAARLFSKLADLDEATDAT